MRNVLRIHMHMNSHIIYINYKQSELMLVRFLAINISTVRTYITVRLLHYMVRCCAEISQDSIYLSILKSTI